MGHACFETWNYRKSIKSKQIGQQRPLLEARQQDGTLLELAARFVQIKGPGFPAQLEVGLAASKQNETHAEDLTTWIRLNDLLSEWSFSID